MAETDQAYSKLAEIARRVENLERTVSALSDTDASRQEAIAHLTAKGGALARVLVCVKEGLTQGGIKEIHDRRWKVISVGSVHSKITELIALGFIDRSESRGRDGYTYTVTPRATHRLMKELDRILR